MRAAPTLALLALAACEGGSNPAVRIELVDPSGENAALGIIEGELFVDVRQGDRSLCAEGCATEIRGGDFELSLPIDGFEELTRIQARMTGGPAELVGAVAPFAVAGEGLETAELPVRLVMMEAGRCAPLELFNVSTSGRPRLVEARRDLGVATRRNVVLLAGGRGAGGGSNRLDLFDQVVVEMRPPLDSPAGALGPTRGLRLSEDQALFVGETAWIVETQVQAPPAAVPVALHAGAGFASALALLRNNAAVIGGTSSQQVTWLTGQTVFEPYDLSEPRAFAAAAAGEEGILVVGGGPGAEWITVDGRTTPIVDGVPDSVGGWVTASPSGQTFLAIGGSGAQTTLFTGCPACVASAGPAWERAREGAAATRTAAGVLWIVGGEGSAAIDRVVWGDDEVPEIVPARDLAIARAGAAVVEHASGVVIVIGGEGVSGMLADVELCTPPDRLDPLL